jgi:hypothetical protein
MNKAIELHDSRVELVSSKNDNLTILFSPAYIHQSDGMPGTDAGTGWTQSAQLILLTSHIEGTWPRNDSDVSDGYLKIGTAEQSNIIHLPLNTNEPVEGEIVFSSGARIHVKARGAKIELIGEPQYVETFSGT